MAFVNAFNAMVENIDYFMGKWKEQINSEDILKRATARRFIRIFKDTLPMEQFDMNLFFELVEMITVDDENKLTVHFFDTSEVECGIENKSYPAGGIDLLTSYFLCPYCLLLL